jgi:signal transduction histidine kinase
MTDQRWGHSERKKNRWRGGLALRIVIVMLVGIVVGAAAMIGAATVYRDSLRTRITTIAQALATDTITPLREDQASSAGSLKADYAYVEDRLARIKDVNGDVRFVYLMARDGTRGVYFLADSESDDRPGNSPRGERYPEASPALKAMFDNGNTLIEGPSRDSYGSWLSALAPVIDDQTYRITAVVGMDVPATDYAWLLGIAGGLPVFVALLASIVVFVRFQTWRRYQDNIQFRAEMLSIASHELRTPLTGLRWSQEDLIRQKVGTPPQQRMLQIMYDSTRRLQESIEDILQLASIESGKARRLYLDDVDMRKLMEDIVATQQLAATRRNVTISFAKAWPQSLVLRVDGQRMKRVFHNLLSNAVKYSKDNTSIMIGFARTSANEYVIFVQDHGIGIPRDEQTAVWGGFYRASNTREVTADGTGMGMYLARSIIEQHGGRIWFESEEGKGTTVFVALPESTGAVAAVLSAQTKG